MTFGFHGEMLKSRLNLRLESRGEVGADDLDLRMHLKAKRLSVIIKGVSVGGKEIKVKEKINIKEMECPGELPSWEVDEMSKGNSIERKQREGGVPEAERRWHFEKGLLCPMLLRGPGR